MNSLALTLTVSLALSAAAPFSPALPERPAVQAQEAVLPREPAAGTPLPEKPVLITFDDGYRSSYDLAYPLLQKYRTKAAIAFMAYTQDNPCGNFLTWDMSREMTASGLVEMGSHGYAIHNPDGRVGSFVPGQASGGRTRMTTASTAGCWRICASALTASPGRPGSRSPSSPIPSTKPTRTPTPT